MGFDEDMKSFEAQLDKAYPNHVRVGDRVAMYKMLANGMWVLRDTGTIMYVGPGYAQISFMKLVENSEVVNLPLTQNGTINEHIHKSGYKFKSA